MMVWAKVVTQPSVAGSTALTYNTVCPPSRSMMAWPKEKQLSRTFEKAREFLLKNKASLEYHIRQVTKDEEKRQLAAVLALSGILATLAGECQTLLE